MKNLLIVDDEEIILSMLSEFLAKPQGSFNVFTAWNGEMAVEVLESSHIDLLLTDLNMPVMDGFELLEYASKNHPDTPAIVMTGSIDPETDKKLHSIGINHCIKKPFDIEEVNSRILSVIGSDYEYNNSSYSIPIQA